ncbi:MAG: hypothetical protein QW273_03540 [Candidatus Pacearchaeota archaeon]
MNDEENLDLIEEHLKIVEELLTEENKKCMEENCSNEKREKLLKTQFNIEKAESFLEEIKEEDNLEFCDKKRKK